MALQKQVVSFPFSGVAEKNSPVTLEPGQMLEVNNGFFQRSGEVRKRFGFSQIQAGSSSTQAIAECGSTQYRIANSFALAGVSGGSMPGLRHSVTVDRLPSGGSDLSTYTDTSIGIVDVARHASTGQVATLGVLSKSGVVIESESDGGFRWMSATPAGGTTRLARIVATQNYWVVVSTNSAGSLSVGRMDTIIGSGFTNTQLVSVVVDATSGIFDMCQAASGTYTDEVLIAYRRAAGSGGGIVVARVNSLGVIQASATDASETVDRCMGWVTHDQANGFAYLVTCSSASGVRVRQITVSTCAIGAPTTIDAAATTAANVTGVRVNSTNHIVYDREIASNYWQTNYYDGSSTRTSYLSKVASRAWYDSTLAKGYVWLMNDAGQGTGRTTNQGMLALAEAVGFPGLIAGSALYARHSNTVAVSCAPSVVAGPSASTWIAGALYVAEGRPESTIRSDRACRLTLNLAPTEIGRPKCFAGTLAIPGFSRTFFFDENALPSATLIQPEPPKLGALGTGGSLTESSSYLYRLTYDIIDDSGRTWRSGPSDPLTVELGAGEDEVNLTLYASPFGSSTYGGRCFYSLWRSSSNGTELRLAKRGEFTVGIPTLAITDTLADTAIDGNPLLYTSIGGELPNYADQNFRLLEVFRNRLFGVSSEFPNTVYYTKELRDGYAPEWVGVQMFMVEDGEGAFTAIGEMDDKLVLFKRNAVYVLTGDGPDLAGNGLYQAPERIANRAGCVNPNSVVKCPLGLMYSSPKGIYLLTRGLEAQYIGAPVETTWKTLTITGAVAVDDQNQVRFMSSQGTTLVYDWVLGVWTTFTGQPAKYCTIWDNRVTWLSQTDGSIQQETPGAWSDNGSAITTSITTGWLSFAALASFKRVKGVRIFGTRQSAHSLVFKIAYDQVDSDVTYPTIADLGSGNPYQPDIWLSRQKLAFLRVKVQDSLASPGEGARWHGLAFEVALKPGFARTSG